MGGKVRVLLVEDDRDLCDSIVEYLSVVGLDVKAVGTGLQFYQELAVSSYSIAVIDLGLPDQSGYTLVEYLRRNTLVGIIIMTARETVEDRLIGYDAGADLYLVKPVDCRELSAAIMNLAKRVKARTIQPVQFPPSQSWRLAQSSWQLITPLGRPIQLTAKEMQFLKRLANTPGSPVSRASLLSALNYRDDEYANRALDALVRRLRRKLEKSWNQQVPIKTIHSVGYCFTASLAIS